MEVAGVFDGVLGKANLRWIRECWVVSEGVGW